MDEIEVDGEHDSIHVEEVTDDILTCNKSGKRYRQLHAMEDHVHKFEGPERDRSVLARGSVMSMEMLQTQDLGVYTSGIPHPHLAGIGIGDATLGCVQVSTALGNAPYASTDTLQKYDGQILDRYMHMSKVERLQRGTR